MLEIILLPLSLAIGFLLGRWMDPIWRAKQLRKLFKKNYIVVALVSKDLKTIQEKVVNADKGVIELDGKIWIVKNGAIYRKDRSKAYEKTFITKRDLKWQEEVPVIYLSEESLRPLTFYKDESTVRPIEVASTLKGWIANQRAKDLASQKQQFIFSIITIVLLIAILFLAWQNWDALQFLRKNVANTMTIFKTVVSQPHR